MFWRLELIRTLTDYYYRLGILSAQNGIVLYNFLSLTNMFLVDVATAKSVESSSKRLVFESF